MSDESRSALCTPHVVSPRYFSAFTRGWFQLSSDAILSKQVGNNPALGEGVDIRETGDRRDTVDRLSPFFYRMDCSQRTVGDYVRVCEDTWHAREPGWALSEALGHSIVHPCAGLPQFEVSCFPYFLHSLCLETIPPNKPCHLRRGGGIVIGCLLLLDDALTVHHLVLSHGVRDTSQASP